MLRFSKISLLVAFCGVALLAAPPTAHADLELLIVAPDGAMSTFTDTNEGTPGTVTANGKFGTFSVNLTGNSNLTTGQLALSASISGGSSKNTLTIQLTETHFVGTGTATPFSEVVNGSIKGPGFAKFQAFLDLSDRLFGIQGDSVTPLPLLGPFKDPTDAPISGSGSTTVTVTNTSSYSMTLSSTIKSGDVIFTSSATNGHPN
jgi:hypothetical protein